MLTALSALPRRTVALALGAVLAVVAPAFAQDRQSGVTEETWRLLAQAQWVSGPQRLDQIGDPKVRIALAWREVAAGRLTAEQFYQEMSKVDLGGRQLREVLVETKTRLLDVLGGDVAEHFLGKLYVQDVSELAAQPARPGEPPPKPALGSAVEDTILGWRSGLAESTKQRTMRRLAQEFGPGSAKYSAFLCDIGSQPKGAGMRTFAGDIDVNLLTAHPQIGRRFLEIWDEEIRLATRLSSTEIDVVATVFGMSGPEVYPGEAGRLKAGEMILEGKAGNIRRVDLATGQIGETVSGRQAMTEVGLQGGLAGIERTPSGEFKLPEKGPALVLDMARHLHRDVLKSMQFEDLDTFLKIAKFVERASVEAQQGGHPLNADTVKFSQELLRAKEAGDYVRATQLIKDFFGGRLPVEVQLGRSRDGKSPLVVEANRQFLQEFGQRCFDDLMASARPTSATGSRT